MNGFTPNTGTAEQWNAAFYRLEDYLRAHGLVNKIHQGEIILRLLRRAAIQHRHMPERSPIELALREAYQEMADWFQRVFPDLDAPPARLCSVGRLSMYLIDAPARWPDVFLTQDELPPDFVRAMRETFVQSGPDLRISTMVPRSPDVPQESTVIEEMRQRLDEILSMKLFGWVCLGLLIAR